MRAPLLLACLFAIAGAGEYPFNGRLELGEVGRVAPGFHLRQWFLPAALAATGGPLQQPLTVADGSGGRCLRVPGVAGRVEYNLYGERFTLAEDGEVEVSFRLRCDDAEDGSWDPAQVVLVDLRAFDPRVLQHKPAAERYPVLQCFNVRPQCEWTTHTRRLAVRGGFAYELMFRCAGPPGRTSLNLLEVDDVVVRPLGPPAAGPGDEVVVVPDRTLPVYGPDEVVTLQVRARLAGPGTAVVATLVDDHDGRVVARQALELAPLPEGLDGCGRLACAATWTLPAPRFGSFSSVLSRAGVPLASTGGDLVVVRPPVHHPPGSPGATLGGDLAGNHTQMQLTASTEPVLHTATARPNEEIELLRLAGLQVVRLWGDWNLVEPQPGTWRADVIGRDLDGIRAAGLEPLLVLGATFTGAPAPGADPPKGGLPPWLYRSATVRPGVVLPPLAAWESYVAACVRLFGDRVRWWEVVNEASNGWTADEYLPRLQAAHRLIKAAAPTALVVGNGATGDVGPRPLDWTRALAGLHHESFLDVVAFHPYGAALDLQGGDRFKYRDLVAGLRALLGEPRPLWNTECFYLASATRAQGVSGEEQATYTAGDQQRHFLDGLWHGVAMSTAPTHDALVKRRRSVPANLIPNQVFAGINALSGLLEGVDGLERIEVNPLVRSGVFSAADGGRGLGFLVDLRPGGSRWLPPAGGLAGITLLDLFGNQLPTEGEVLLHCGSDPLYLRGDPAALARLFRASRWQVAEPLHLVGRSFAGRLHVEALNRTGMAARALLAFPGSGLPAVACGFRAAERFTAVLPELALPARLPWTASADGEAVAAGLLAAAAPASELVLVLDQPLRATLPLGSVLTLTARSDHLVITAEVPEPEPRPAPGEALHAGSALEVFIDSAPGFRPDCDAVASGSEKMPVTQYIAAALPAATGQTLWSQSHRRPQAVSGARAERSRTATGWQVRLEVPWDDLVPPDGAPLAFGLDAEIDRLGAEGRPVKEAWGPLPGESWRRRAHYPVLVLPPAVVARYREPVRAVAWFGGAPPVDGGFEEGRGWQLRGGPPALRLAEGAGFAGSRGVDITVAPADSAALPPLLTVHQTLPCRQHSGKTVQLSFLLRLTDLRAATATTAEGYHCGFTAQLHYRDGLAGQHLDNDGLGLTSAVLGSQDWTLVTCLSPIPDRATEITLSLGTRGPVSGRVQIDAVDLRYLDP